MRQKGDRNERIVALYKDGVPIVDIGDRFGISHQRVCQIVKAAGVSLRGRASGEDHFRWNGGRYTDSRGYVRVLDKDNPMADSAGYVLEHRLVVSRELDRPLEADEHVHHINGVRDDNRPGNLILMTAEDHWAHHADERRIGRDVLLAHLVRIGAKFGRTPTSADMNEDPLSPYHPTYIREFGSIRAAQRAAGFMPNGLGGAPVTSVAEDTRGDPLSDV